ncbi:MAG TPA: DNA (cytosine-5-)-methyltransferase [Candidatus Eisenbacteria bacterium]
MRFVDLFAGLGGFHYALRALGHECVFASEIDPELRELYARNFPDSARRVFGDIREFAHRVPRHDVLCAGFPCQPFSKSGYQRGRRDRRRGTLFHEIAAILEHHLPRYVILENVGNFERHNYGRTWRIVRQTLQRLGYCVRGTTHVASGGHGLISPHHLGYPQSRERFFIVASLNQLREDPFPKADRTRVTTLGDIVMRPRELRAADREETSLPPARIECIKHWNRFVRAVPRCVELPSFPLWGDEFGARYPFSERTPHVSPMSELKRVIRHRYRPRPTRAQLISFLPSYARSTESVFPAWKVAFIQQNRDYFRRVRGYLPAKWLEDLASLPASHRKLEWNCNGEVRDLWQCVLQFRPSGLRAKRYTSSPALVALNTTQTPILGPERRFITRVEGLRLQGFPDSHNLPKSRENAFAALGNAVHTGVASAIASRLLTGRAHESEGDLEAWIATLEEHPGTSA